MPEIYTDEYAALCAYQEKLSVLDEANKQLKLPVSKGGTHSRDNLMSLCRSCHNKIHIEMGER